MTDRIGTSACLVLLLAAFGCGGQSEGAPHESPSTGGGSGNGGSSASGGSGGRGGGAGDGGDGGAGAGTGSGATSGDGGTSSAGASGSSSGGGGTAGTGPAGAGGAAPNGPLSGRWGMFWFEDPVAVEIRQEAQALSGVGCCAGLPGAPQAVACCGPLEGTSTDGQASFAYSIQDVGAVYGTNVYVSEDYRRMGGTFSVDDNGSLAVAWVRIAPGEANLGAPPAPLREALAQREGTFELMLSSASVGRFEPGTPLELQLSGLGLIRGAFGPFYWGDMLWLGEALVVGPVSATDPSFATSLELRFNDDALESVVVTYPNDPPYHFAVTGTTR
jgi:hypothetical protein